ncbi:MAG: hypothetical protein CMJ18_07660 [Phycisphaeraceae bacterium]|nr:hypothetical protein [Phycisphaeraceae bacterium]
MSETPQTAEKGAKPKVRCRLLGHRFFWLDVNRRHHCARCGVTDKRFVEQSAQMRRISPRFGCDCDECETALRATPAERSNQ